MYEYFSLMLEMQKNPKMSFNGQPNMFFNMFISCTCDPHLKLDILNPLNIIFLSNGFLNESLALQPFPSNFKTLKLLNDFVFHEVHSINMYFHRRGHVFVVQNFLNQLYDFIPSFLLLFFKCTLNT